MAVYYLLTLIILPPAYLSAPRLEPLPMLTDVSITTQGQTVKIAITGTNQGDAADLQIVSAAFPNLTSTDNLKVTRHNFTQTPVFIKTGMEIGSGYEGMEKPVPAQYPSIEAVSRPWGENETYYIEIEVKPETTGRFVVFVKAVALPHFSELAHYPRDGITDHQGEFVLTYSVMTNS